MSEGYRHPDKEGVLSVAEPSKGIQDLADQIMAAYDAYHDAVERQIQRTDRYREAKLDLEATEDALRLEGKLDGKNAEDRATQLRGFAEERYLRYQAAEGEYKLSQMATARALELLRTTRALGSLLSGTSHA
jgi:hypothetical protein